MKVELLYAKSPQKIKMTRADALRPHLKFRRWRGRFGVMTENQNHIKATACRIWKFAEKIACGFYKRFAVQGRIVAIVWTVSVLVWLAAIATSFLFDKWETVRNFALFSTPLLGFPLLFQRTMAQDKQADAAIKRAESALMQAKTDSRRRLAEAFARAVEQFASVELAMRLAGLYALWKVAEEDIENYHVQIMQILCAFVRNPPELKGWKLDGNKFLVKRSDMEAVLTLIRERNEEQQKQEHSANYRLNFTDADLRMADFHGAYLRESNFSGTDLRDSFFINVDLQSAWFSGADLRGAGFFWADLRNAHFDDRTQMGTHGDVYGRAVLANAAINGTILSEVQNLPSIDDIGVVLTDEAGNILFPGFPSLRRQIDETKLRRMTLQKWEKKRGKKANA